MMNKCYSEMLEFDSYIDRYNYLRQCAKVGQRTFGWTRIFNQSFYRSKEWKDLRNSIIVRDGACDMAHSDYPIGEIIIHHINPITLDDLNDHSSKILDPENLVCVSHNTHNAIHYGDSSLLVVYEERRQYDTCPWKKLKGGNSK